MLHGFRGMEVLRLRCKNSEIKMPQKLLFWLSREIKIPQKDFLDQNVK